MQCIFNPGDDRVATEKCRYIIFHYYAFLGVLHTFKWVSYFEGKQGSNGELA